MADVFTKEKRSEVMGKIRSANTKPELIVRRYLFATGFRYRLHDKKLAGKPDIVLPKYKTVINIHGCFWHGHRKINCKDSRLPKSNLEYWKNKIASNQQRDFNNGKFLRKSGWNLITVWSCQLDANKKSDTLKAIVDKILIKSKQEKKYATTFKQHLPKHRSNF